MKDKYYKFIHYSFDESKIPIVNNRTLKKDECKGKKLGKKEPDNGKSYLDRIKSEEMGNILKIKKISCDNPPNQNDKQKPPAEKTQNQNENIYSIEELQKYKGLRNSATYTIFFAFILIVIDLAVIVIILQQIYHSLLEVIPIGILLNLVLIFAIKLILEKKEKQDNENVEKLKKYIFYSGFSLVLLGLIGLTVLRAIVFNYTIHRMAINPTELNTANLLLTLGLGVGAPLIVGVLFESESEKLKNANIYLSSYYELLKNEKINELYEKYKNSFIKTMHSNIENRINRFIHGYISGLYKGKGKQDFDHYRNEINQERDKILNNIKEEIEKDIDKICGAEPKPN